MAAFEPWARAKPVQHLIFGLLLTMKRVVGQHLAGVSQYVPRVDTPSPNPSAVTRHWCVRCALRSTPILILAATTSGCAAKIARDGFMLDTGDWSLSERDIRTRAAFGLSCPRDALTLKVLALHVPASIGYANQVGVARMRQVGRLCAVSLRMGRKHSYRPTETVGAEMIASMHRLARLPFAD